jgi:glycosyltransferase involved in cell wall biosynthesis
VTGAIRPTHYEKITLRDGGIILDKIAVLIPCYNEEKTIGKVVEDARRALPEATIYVYNNNSKDRTAEIAAAAGAVVRNEYMQGKGNVIRRMFREIDALVYVMVDGDDTYPMDAAPEMVDLVLNHNSDMVVGDRLSSTYYQENKRPFHNFGNNLVRGSINRLFKCNIRDIMTGFRAFSYEFVKTFPVLSKGFEIETEMTIHAVYNNMQIDNVIIDYRDRPEGSVSKLNTFDDGFKVLRTIARLYRSYKPFGFFSMVAAILAILAIIFLVPIFKEYWQTGLVPRFPTLIVCCFVMMSAVLSLFAGTILSTLALNDRREFEMQLNMLQRHKETDAAKGN